MPARREPLGVIAHRLAAAMSYGMEVEADLRQGRSRRTVTGPVTYRRTFKLPPLPTRRGEPLPERSNLVVTIGGEEIEVNWIVAVRRAGAPPEPPPPARRRRRSPARRRSRRATRGRR